MSECVGIKPICPNGQSAVCVKGEWECREQIAIDELQSSKNIDGSEGANGND